MSHRRSHAFLIASLAIGLATAGGLLAQSPDAIPAPLSDSPQENPSGAGTTPPAGEDVAVPVPYPEERYKEAWNKNPFMLKTAPVAQPKASWAEDWKLAGMSNILGSISVSLKNVKTNEFKRLKEGGADKDGFVLEKANFDRDRKKASVEVTKDGRKETLTYDDEMLAGPAAGAGIPQPGVIPGRTAIPGRPGIPGAYSQPGKPGSIPGAAPGTTGYRPGMASGANMQATLRPGMGGVAAPGQTVPPGSLNRNVSPAAGVLSGATGGVPGTLNQPGGVGGVPIGQPGVTVPVQPTVPTPVSRRRQLIPPPIQQ